MQNIELMVENLHNLVLRNKLLVTVAESCTGGLLSSYLTDIPGCSAWFERGFITYSNAAKQEMLGVNATLIKKFGAVSQEVALAMAEGALKNSLADVAIAITGIAGPSSDGSKKPVGTVWIAFASKNNNSNSHNFAFNGDRAAIRKQSVFEAVQGLISFIIKNYEHNV